MDQSKITVRYAKALFTLAKEQGRIETFKTDIELVLSVINSCSDFVLLLETPIVKTSQKTKAIKLIFQDKIDSICLRFLELIVENKRETYIPGICRNFLEYIRKEQGIKTALITSATPLNKSTVDQIRIILEKEFKGKIELGEKVNENLIGGFVLRIDDQQYDASIATQLKKIREDFLNIEIK